MKLFLDIVPSNLIQATKLCYYYNWVALKIVSCLLSARRENCIPISNNIQPQMVMIIRGYIQTQFILVKQNISWFKIMIIKCLEVFIEFTVLNNQML